MKLIYFNRERRRGHFLYHFRNRRSLYVTFVRLYVNGGKICAYIKWEIEEGWDCHCDNQVFDIDAREFCRSFFRGNDILFQEFMAHEVFVVPQLFASQWYHIPFVSLTSCWNYAAKSIGCEVLLGYRWHSINISVFCFKQNFIIWLEEIVWFVK